MNTVDSEPLVVVPILRTDGTYVLRLCVQQGLLTPGMLKTVTETMAKFNLTALRATTGQRLNLEGVPRDKLNEVVASLGSALEKTPPGVSVCPGAGNCKYGRRETREIGAKVLDLVKQNAPYPFKVKSGVSGCKFACGLSFVRDIGLVGGAKGWTVLFGGSATRNAGPGMVLGENLSNEEALALVEKALVYYRENGKKRERSSGMVKRLGEAAVLAAVK